MLCPRLICSVCILLYMPRANFKSAASSNLPTCCGCNKRRNIPTPSRAQSTTGVSPFVLLLHNCWWSGGYDKSQSNPFFSSYYCCCFCSLLLPHLCVPRDNMTCIAQRIPVILNKSLTDGIRLAHLSVFILKLWTADIADSILI